MPDVLGPRAKRVDILVYKGIRWSTLFSLALNNVDIVLSTGTITTRICRSFDKATLDTFDQVALNATQCLLEIPESNPIEPGRSIDDPAGKYVYSVAWTSSAFECLLFWGVLTMGPV
jgi:hypothetical protein